VTVIGRRAVVHRDPPNDVARDLSSRDKNRRVFWATKHIDVWDGDASRHAANAADAVHVTSELRIAPR